MTELKFGQDLIPSVFYISDGNKITLNNKLSENGITASDDKIEAHILFEKSDAGFEYRITVKNLCEKTFEPETLGVNLGIDTYLEKYPEWNEKYFPSAFRCEKTHFWGYYMQPSSNKVIGVFCEEPIASYGWDYNRTTDENWGHRIHGAYVSLLNCLPLPKRHPQNLISLEPSQQIERRIKFSECNSLNEFSEILSENGIPYISAERFTLSDGESINYTINCRDACKASITAPSGSEKTDNTVTENGIYTLSVTTDKGKTAEALFYCRKSWEWYLKQARNEVIKKPPHATTHCESWYGFYTGFLAAKHYPDEVADKIVNDMFDEIMPYMFDFENIEPKLIPERIQNIASFIGILVDRYESDPEKHIGSLETASKFADRLITRQGADGAYYRTGIHYTCVIYPAKTMLELVLAERKAAEKHKHFAEAAERHFKSAEKAVDNLASLLENIGTEGEHTLEDGMISCSCSQLAYFALFLPENKRKRYIDAAEHMLKVHRCLEQLAVPDCRSRGTTIRYWEAQYDIILRKNMITSPHGWSAWLSYGLYYLYLLTGKEEYLIQLMDSIGACTQLMSERGELRWAFAVDPYVRVDKMLVKDTESPIKDAYRSVNLTEPAYRGRMASAVVGEQYLDMISGWFRTGEAQKVTGGFYHCELILKDKVLNVDKQGGCCDNDVHEIFKCLEETVLKKAFVLKRDDGTLLSFNCALKADRDTLLIEETETADCLHLNLNESSRVIWKRKTYQVPKGLTLLCDGDCEPKPY